eukprot:2424585-Amphidinium_carterae.1
MVRSFHAKFPETEIAHADGLTMSPVPAKHVKTMGSVFANYVSDEVWSHQWRVALSIPQFLVLTSTDH